MAKAKSIAENKFFMGANTSKGFVNYAGEIFSGLEKTHILKGGPGTGKSTLMKKIFKIAVEKGYSPELYYCSSDSDSLDGIVIRNAGIGITDGTPPHVMEPKFPGAKDEILNLGKFLDSDGLKKEILKIKDLSERKSSLYSSVFCYLDICGKLNSEKIKALYECTDIEKAGHAAGNLLKHMGSGTGYLLRNRQISALGMNGITVLDTLRNMSSEIWYLKDKRGLNGVFFKMLLKEAEKKSQEVWVSRNPLLDIDALYFPENRVLVTGYKCGDECQRVINTERFVMKEPLKGKNSELHFIYKSEKELSSHISDIFSDISKCHFALENLYGSYMDFSHTDEIIKCISEKF